MTCRNILTPLLLNALVACMIGTPAAAQEDDCTVCGRETGFVPVDDQYTLTEGTSLWLDVELDCIVCGRETGFLPKDGRATVAFKVEEGLHYQLSLTPTWGAVPLTAISLDGELTCQPSVKTQEVQTCGFEAWASGKALAEFHAVTDTTFELTVLAATKPL
jgi:hypothetical protein